MYLRAVLKILHLVWPVNWKTKWIWSRQEVILFFLVDNVFLLFAARAFTLETNHTGLGLWKRVTFPFCPTLEECSQGLRKQIQILLLNVQLYISPFQWQYFPQANRLAIKLYCTWSKSLVRSTWIMPCRAKWEHCKSKANFHTVFCHVQLRPLFPMWWLEGTESVFFTSQASK